MGLPAKIHRMPGPKAPDIELDLGRYELRRGGRRVKLEKKPMELLIFLVGRREQLVSREDIVARLWHSGLFVDTERNINNIVRKIRTALGDKVEEPRFLETVIGKGYRFIGPIRVISPLYQDSEVRESSDTTATPRPAHGADRSCLAVLPLRFPGERTDDNGLSLGFADALVSRLANLEGVDVLPTSSILNVPSAPPAETARQLGVRFLVSGVVHVSKRESRLALEMFDANSQSSLFSRKFAFDTTRPFERIEEIAADTARALRRPLHQPAPKARERYSRDPLAYAEYMQGYRHSSSGDGKKLEKATQHLMNAVARDPSFALAHAVLSYVYATRHFEFDPGRIWLEKAEFHCQRALELDSSLPEGHVAKAFLLWGPSRNFQHIEAISELKHAIALQKNLPHAYNRLGTILAHIGLFDHALTMFERGRPFNPGQILNHSVAQVYLWSGQHELTREEVEKWRGKDPGSKYALHFGLQLAILTGDRELAKSFLAEAAALVKDEPLMVSFKGVVHAWTGESEQALDCVNRACANPRSFGHAHHTYYQIACIFSLLNRTDAAFEWLERSVDTGFPCWPFFLKDPCLKNLRRHSQFDLLVGSLQAKYPDHLGLL